MLQCRLECIGLVWEFLNVYFFLVRKSSIDLTQQGNRAFRHIQKAVLYTSEAEKGEYIQISWVEA